MQLAVQRGRGVGGILIEPIVIGVAQLVVAMLFIATKAIDRAIFFFLCLFVLHSNIQSLSRFLQAVLVRVTTRGVPACMCRHTATSCVVQRTIIDARQRWGQQMSRKPPC